MKKKGALGAQDKKWPKDSHDVGGRTLIPWLKTVQKMDAVGSRMLMFYDDIIVLCIS
jgi:hypothetical protein